MKIPTFVSHALLGAALGVAPVTQANPVLIGNDYAKGSDEFSVTVPTTTTSAGCLYSHVEQAADHLAPRREPITAPQSRRRLREGRFL